MTRFVNNILLFFLFSFSIRLISEILFERLVFVFSLYPTVARRNPNQSALSIRLPFLTPTNHRSAETANHGRLISPQIVLPVNQHR